MNTRWLVLGWVLGCAPVEDDQRPDREVPTGQVKTDSTSGTGSFPQTGTETFGGEITVNGRQLQVDGLPIHLRGVCWNPVGVGQVHPSGLDFSGFAEQDIALMQAAGINAVRTYEPLTDVAVLDQFAAAQIYVLNTIYPYGGSAVEEAVSRVASVQDHPAILMWVIGNEWNYNGLYADLSFDASVARVAEVSAAVAAIDDTHPVATVYGGLPGAATVDALPDVDIWGINAYGGTSFGGLFDAWAASSDRPMFLAEYGADAYNTLIEAYDPVSQEEAVVALTVEIANHSSATGPDGVAIGGTVFEWADEWWKDGAGSPSVHDTGGYAPGSGPHPDLVFNEEWWGLVDIARNPRPVYTSLQGLFLPP
jgi:hypothetical protein